MMYGDGAPSPGCVAIGGNEIGNPILQSAPLALGTPAYLRIHRVAGTLRLFVNEALVGSAANASAWGFSLIGLNIWDGSNSYLNAVMSEWVARTSGIATSAGALPTQPQSPAVAVNSLTNAQSMDRVFNGGVVRFSGGVGSVALGASGVSTPLIRSMRGRDMVDGGTGVVSGTVKRYISAESQVPQRARVTLLRQRDRRPIRVAWSDPETGAFAFAGVDTATRRYVTLAEYPSNPGNPNAENYMRPVAGVSPLDGEA